MVAGVAGGSNFGPLGFLLPVFRSALSVSLSLPLILCNLCPPGGLVSSVFELG